MFRWFLRIQVELGVGLRNVGEVVMFRTDNWGKVKEAS